MRPEPDQGRRVVREAPIGAEVGALPALARRELGDAPLARKHLGVRSGPGLPAPDMREGFRVGAEERVGLLAKDLRKVGVIPVGDEPNHRALGGRDDEPLIGRVGLEGGVEGDPDLRARLPDRRDEDAPGVIGDGLGLLDPGDVDPFGRLDLGDVAAEPLEEELGPVTAQDGGLLDRVEVAQAEELDLIGEDAVHRVPDRGLILARAEDTEGLGDAVHQEGAGELPGLRGAASPVGAAIPEGAERGVEEIAEGRRGRDGERCHPKRSGWARCVDQ